MFHSSFLLAQVLGGLAPLTNKPQDVRIIPHSPLADKNIAQRGFHINPWDPLAGPFGWGPLAYFPF